MVRQDYFSEEQREELLADILIPCRGVFPRGGQSEQETYSMFCRGVISYAGQNPSAIVFKQNVIYEGGAFEINTRRRVVLALDASGVQPRIRRAIKTLTETEFHGGREGSGVHGEFYEALQELERSRWTKIFHTNKYTGAEMKDIEGIVDHIQKNAKGATVPF